MKPPTGTKLAAVTVPVWRLASASRLLFACLPTTHTEATELRKALEQLAQEVPELVKNQDPKQTEAPWVHVSICTKRHCRSFCDFYRC